MEEKIQKVVRMDTHTADILVGLSELTDRSQEGVIRWLINTAGRALEQSVTQPPIQNERKQNNG